MLITVFQFLPSLQEETQTDSTELAQKSCEDDNSENDNTETDSDTDDVLNNHFIFCFINLHPKNNPLPSKQEDYNSFFQKINIPPPKV